MYACVYIHVYNIAVPTLTPQQQLLKVFNTVMPGDVLSITLKLLETNLAVHPDCKKGKAVNTINVSFW